MEEKILNIGIVVFCVIIFGLVVMRLSGMKFKLPQAKKVEEKIEAIEEMEGKVLRVWVGFVILVSINALFFYIIPEENWWEVSSWIARAATGAAFASWMKYSYFSSKSQWGKANSFRFLAWIVTIMALIFIGISMSGGENKRKRELEAYQAIERQRQASIKMKESEGPDAPPLGMRKLGDLWAPPGDKDDYNWSKQLTLHWPGRYSFRYVDERGEKTWVWKEVTSGRKIEIVDGYDNTIPSNKLRFKAKFGPDPVRVIVFGDSYATFDVSKVKKSLAKKKTSPRIQKSTVYGKTEEKKKWRATNRGGAYGYQSGLKSTDPAEEKKRSDYREYIQGILKSKRMGSGVQSGLPEKKSDYERQYEYQKKYQEKPKITQKTEEKISKKKERSGGIKIIQRNPESPPVGFRKLGNLWAPSKNKDEWSGKLNMCCEQAKYRFRCADKQKRSVVLAEITFKSGEKMTVNGYGLKILELNSGDKIRIRSKGLSAIQVIVFGNEYAKFDVVNRPKQREMTPEELFRELERH